MLKLSHPRTIVAPLRRLSSTVSGSAANDVLNKGGNITPKIAEKIGRNLHLQPHHPLNLVKNRIQALLPNFKMFDQLAPVVPSYDNFDSLLVPADHVSRAESDTYYVDREHTHVLRTHTSAHQAHLIRGGNSAFLVCGDVYRRDEIDRTHYPVFHQIEGVYTQPIASLGGAQPKKDRCPASQETHSIAQAEEVCTDLKEILEKIAADLFPASEIRWVPAYFPFTHPSYELEVLYNGEWMEILGSGVIEQRILDSAGASDRIGWAFGIGLERIAMALYSIPDIRLFWSTDTRFLSQFSDLVPADTIVFQPFSKYPAARRDVSFWLPPSTLHPFHENTLMELIRDTAGDLVESVKCIDDFTNSDDRRSLAYSIVYRSMDKTFTKAEIEAIHQSFLDKLVAHCHIEIRQRPLKNKQ